MTIKEGTSSGASEDILRKLAETPPKEVPLDELVTVNWNLLDAKDAFKIIDGLKKHQVKGVRPLIGALDHVNNGVKVNAAEAIGSIAETSLEGEFRESVEGAESVFDDAVEPLLAAYREVFFVSDKTKILNQVGRIPTRKASNALEQEYSIETAAQYRGTIIRSLSRIGCSDSLELITGALDDENALVRKAARDALILDYGGKAVDFLTERKQRNEEPTKGMISGILAEIEKRKTSER